MKNRPNNECWFFIKAKDGSCAGYMSGKTKEEACERFGLKVQQCSIKEVIKTDKGFVWPNLAVQERLL